MTFIRLAEEKGSPDTSEIWEVRGRQVAQRLRSAKIALVTLSVLKSSSFKVCVMVDARLKRSLGSCVKINMVWKELERLRPDWMSWSKSWIMEEIFSVALQGWI